MKLIETLKALWGFTQPTQLSPEATLRLVLMRVFVNLRAEKKDSRPATVNLNEVDL